MVFLSSPRISWASILSEAVRRISQHTGEGESKAGVQLLAFWLEDDGDGGGDGGGWGGGGLFQFAFPHPASFNAPRQWLPFRDLETEAQQGYVT